MKLIWFDIKPQPTSKGCSVAVAGSFLLPSPQHMSTSWNKGGDCFPNLRSQKNLRIQTNAWKFKKCIKYWHVVRSCGENSENTFQCRWITRSNQLSLFEHVWWNILALILKNIFWWMDGFVFSTGSIYITCFHCTTIFIIFFMSRNPWDFLKEKRNSIIFSSKCTPA